MRTTEYHCHEHGEHAAEAFTSVAFAFSFGLIKLMFVMFFAGLKGTALLVAWAFKKLNDTLNTLMAHHAVSKL